MVELLVTLFVSGVTLTAAINFFVHHARALRAHSFRIETQQAMRGSLDAITRDLRLAGACLPINGSFIGIAGTNVPGGDTITIRTGLTRNNLSCIVNSLAAAAVPGATSVSIDDTNGFAPDMLVYVALPANPSGEFFRITSVTPGIPGTLTFDTALGQAYPSLSSVYAVDERRYSIDASNPDLPLLTLTVNRGVPQAFAAGVTDLQIQYVLDDNCPPCDRVDLPADDAEWHLVNSVDLTATVTTVGAVRPEDEATMVATSTAKPRNLLP